MGSGQSVFEFHPDQTKRSKGSQLPNHKLVIFGENTVNQVAYLWKPLPRSGQEPFHARIKLVYDSAAGNPVIGLAKDEIDLQNINIEKDPSLFLFYVAKGRVEYQGEVQQLPQPMPIAESEAEISLHYVPTTKQLTITVANPGKDSLSEGITLDSFSSNDLLPFVGATVTGNSPTKFYILPSSTTDHTNNSLIDITHKVLFTTSYGVVDISKNCKSITRTSTQQGNGCAMLPIKLVSGLHRWGFEVWSDFGASLCMGLARYPFMLSEDYLKDHVKHVYRHPGLLVYRSYRGLLYKDGKQLHKSLEPLGWQHGMKVTIEFIFDSERGTLEVVKNNKSMGFAFEGLTGIFQPVVGFYAAYEKDVRLKQYLTTEPLLEMTVQSSPNSLESSIVSTGGQPSKKATVIESESVGFEESLVLGSTHVSTDKKTLYRDKSQAGNSVGLLDVICSKQGTYRFVFIVEFDHGASSCIGVTPAKDLSGVKVSDVGNVYNSVSLYLYRSFQGMLYARGKEQSARLQEFWMSGTLVEMAVKVDGDGECSVHFKVNTEDQGAAFTGLKAPLRPLVAFYAGMEKRITSIHYEFVTDEPAPKTALPAPQPPLFETDSGLNDIDTDMTHAKPSQLPILCTSDNAAVFYPCCMECNKPNNIIALPCKHSTVCSNDMTIGVNARTRHCMVCDEKIVQVWNVLLRNT